MSRKSAAAATGATAVTGAPESRAGIGGWTYAPWRANFYPADLLQRRELEYASHALRTVEVNGTFYRAQKPATYAKWAAQTPAGFVFSVKAPRYITASRKWADAGAGARRFIEGGLAQLGERLGPILWQLPPTRTFVADELDSFLQSLPRKLEGRPLRHALEARHESFLCEDYVALARIHGVATVFTDAADAPSMADLTADFVYARLKHSRDDQPAGYTAKELAAWAQRARIWTDGGDPDDLPHVTAPGISKGPRDVFIYFIGAAKQRNPAAAMALQKRMDAHA